MNADAVSRAVAVLTRRVGLRMDPGLRGRLERCLHEAAGSEDVGDYIGRLETDPAALQALLNTLTVQHTSFFRDHHQFEVLARDVVPALAAPVTIWSAGCANG